MLQNSPSQIETYSLCKRKWAWAKLAGFYPPQSPGAALGEECHEQIENYLDGKPLDFTKKSGYIVSSGIEYVPSPDTDLLFKERRFHFEASEASYLGRIDCEIPGVVIDWKTTKDFRYQKSEEELRTDPQVILYACDYFRRHPDEPSVVCRWVYFRTQGIYKTQKTEITITQQEAWDGLQRLEKISREMAEIQNDAAPKNSAEIAAYILSLPLPPRMTGTSIPEACGHYGGCPHRGRCTDIDPLNILFSRERSKNMGLLNKKPAAQQPPPQQINPPEQHLPVAAEFVAQPMPVKETPAPKAPAPGLLDRVRRNLTLPAMTVVVESAAESTRIADMQSFCERYPDIDPSDLTPEQISRVNVGMPITPFHAAPPADAPKPAPVVLPPLEPAKPKRGRPRKTEEKTVSSVQVIPPMAPPTPGEVVVNVTPALNEIGELVQQLLSTAEEISQKFKLLHK